MSVLDELPRTDSFFGTDLKTGAMIVAALGIVHPMAYGCTLFVPINYLIVTIWVLVAIYFMNSILLMHAIEKNDSLTCSIFVWYALLFVFVMLILMIIIMLMSTANRETGRVCIAIFGMMWYILTIYFIFVVNSYRMKLKESKMPETEILARFSNKQNLY